MKSRYSILSMACLLTCPMLMADRAALAEGLPAAPVEEVREIRRVLIAGPGDSAGAEREMQVRMIGSPPGLAFSGAGGELRLAAMNADLGRYFGTEEGVLLLETPETGTQPGLLAGDVIVEIGGRRPETPDHALRIIHSYQPGERIELKVVREGTSQVVGYARTEGEAMRWLGIPAPHAPR